MRRIRLLLLVTLFSVVTAYSSKAADILLGDTTVCVGTEAQLEIVGDFSTLSWSPATTLSCDNCPNPRATPVETTTYTATFTENGIVELLSITVFIAEINSLPDLTICKNTPVQLNAGAEFIGFEYFWEPANIFTCSDCPNPELINTAAVGPIDVRYGISSGGCTVVDTFSLTVLDFDGPVYTVLQDARFCDGDELSIGGNMNPLTTYSWTSSPSGFTSSDANPMITPAATTEYYLEATSATCPLVSRDTVRAILSNAPVISFPQDMFEICEGDTIAITSGIIGESDVQYEWAPELSVFQPMELNTTAAPTVTTIFELTASKGVCEVKDSIIVDVIPISLEIMQGDTLLICKGSTAQLDISASPDPFMVQWSPTEELSSAMGPNVSITNLNGEFTVFASITNGVCSLKDSIYFRVDSLPLDMGILPQDTTICEGEFVILKSPVFEPLVFPDIEFIWEPRNGAFQTGDSLYNAVVTPTDTTDYVRYVTNGACMDSSLVTVNVQPVEDIQVTPADTTICQGESFNYQVLSANLEDFMWMPGTGLSCLDCPNPTATPAGSTEYMIQATDNMGCPVMGTASVTVVPPPELNFAGTGQICPGQTVILNNPAIPGITYSWTSNDPNFADTNNPTPSANPTGDFNYTAVMSGLICADVSQTIDIVVIPPATLSVTDNPTICPGDQVRLTASSGGVDGSFEWNTGESGASISVMPGTTEDYRVTFSNQCQTLSLTATVMLEDPFSPGVIPDPARTNINLGESLDLNLSASIPNDQIANVMWSENGNGIGNGTSINVTPPLEGANAYTVKVTTINGCEYEGAIIIVASIPGVIVPNAFTPNNDGLNDELNIVRIVGDIEVNSFIIFDRWGNKVYESDDGGWDGTFNGKPMPSDVYVYLVEFALPDGTVEARRGEISLIR